MRASGMDYAAAVTSVRVGEKDHRQAGADNPRVSEGKKCEAAYPNWDLPKLTVGLSA